MTIKVYEVDRYGTTVRVVQPKAEVVPAEQPSATDVFPACRCKQCRRAADTVPDRPLPAPDRLTWDQSAGRACIWCAEPLTSGAVRVGTIHDRMGAHVLDSEAWTGPCCLTKCAH